MKKTWIIIGVVIVLIIVLITLTSGKSKRQELKVLNNSNGIQNDNLTQGSAVITPESLSPESKVESFTVVGGNYYYEPNIIKVKEGDTVIILFKNNDGFHDFKIDELNVATSQMKDGVEESVTFVASKKGSYEYYCSVGQHRAMGMKGTLIVE